MGVSDLTGLNETTIHVRYSGPLRFRFWAAGVLMRIVAWLIGANAYVAREAEK